MDSGRRWPPFNWSPVVVAVITLVVRVAGRCHLHILPCSQNQNKNIETRSAAEPIVKSGPRGSISSHFGSAQRGGRARQSCDAAVNSGLSKSGSGLAALCARPPGRLDGAPGLYCSCRSDFWFLTFWIWSFRAVIQATRRCSEFWILGHSGSRQPDAAVNSGFW